MKWHRIKAMLLNHYYVSTSSADRLFDIFYWPVLDILIWGFMTHFIQGISEVNVLQFILGGIVLWVFVWRGSQDFTVYILENFWSRNIYHLFSTPIKKMEFMVSLCILGVIRSLVAFTFMSILGFLLYKFNIFSFNWAHAMIFIGILLIFSWGLGLLISSFIFWFGTRVQVLAWSTVWIIQPFSCVFYPLEALPSWAANIARILPTTHIFEGLRGSIAGQPLNVGSMIYALVFCLVFLAVAAFIVTKSINSAKRQGSFAKPE
jgi:ABC-2 type transport system permease protein